MSRSRSLGALAALAAVLLLLVAVDALRWERRLAADDLRFRAAPASAGLWRTDAVLPAGAVERLLGVGDDVAYRESLRRFWPIRPGQPVVGPELEALRGQVQAELARASAASHGERRSHVLNLLGVLTVGRYYGGYYSFSSVGLSDSAERSSVLRSAIGLFQAAIEADPGNRDAKLNLELLLRDPGAVEFFVDDPGGAAAEGRATGAGRGGSGY